MPQRLDALREDCHCRRQRVVRCGGTLVDVSRAVFRARCSFTCVEAIGLQKHCATHLTVRDCLVEMTTVFSSATTRDEKSKWYHVRRPYCDATLAFGLKCFPIYFASRGRHRKDILFLIMGQLATTYRCIHYAVESRDLASMYICLPRHTYSSPCFHVDARHET